MGKNDSLGCLEKRDLLNQPAASVGTLLRWAASFEEKGLIHDAVDFYVKAGASEELRRLFAVAREEGDFFLFTRLCRGIEYEPAPAEWVEIARRAEELGKLAFAANAFRQGGADDEVGRLAAGS